MNIQKKITRVSKVEGEEADKIKFRDTDNTLYTLWKNKKDGNMTSAFDMWPKIPDKFGADLEISYTETPYEFVGKNGKTVTGTHKNAIGFKWGVQNNLRSTFVPAQKMAEKVSTDKALRQSVSEVDWDAIAEGKVRNNVAVAYIKMGKPLSTSKIEMAEWVKWIMKGDFTTKNVPMPIKDEPEDESEDIGYPTPLTSKVREDANQDVDLSSLPF